MRKVLQGMFLLTVGVMAAIGAIEFLAFTACCLAFWSLVNTLFPEPQ